MCRWRVCPSSELASCLLQGAAQDLLFFCTARYNFAILSYNSTTGTVATEAAGDIRVSSSPGLYRAPCIGCVPFCARSLMAHSLMLLQTLTRYSSILMINSFPSFASINSVCGHLCGLVTARRSKRFCTQHVVCVLHLTGASFMFSYELTSASLNYTMLLFACPFPYSPIALFVTCNGSVVSGCDWSRGSPWSLVCNR